MDYNNHICIVGNVAKTPTIGSTRAGDRVANVVVVTVHRRRLRDGSEHEESTFIPVECFEKTAAWVEANLSPGARVQVWGRWKNVSWGHGEEKKVKSVIADPHFSLLR